MDNINDFIGLRLQQQPKKKKKKQGTPFLTSANHTTFLPLAKQNQKQQRLPFGPLSFPGRIWFLLVGSFYFGSNDGWIWLLVLGQAPTLRGNGRTPNRAKRRGTSWLFWKRNWRQHFFLNNKTKICVRECSPHHVWCIYTCNGPTTRFRPI